MKTKTMMVKYFVLAGLIAVILFAGSIYHFRALDSQLAYSKLRDHDRLVLLAHSAIDDDLNIEQEILCSLTFYRIDLQILVEQSDKSEQSYSVEFVDEAKRDIENIRKVGQKLRDKFELKPESYCWEVRALPKPPLAEL